MRIIIESPYNPSPELIASMAGTYTAEELLAQNVLYARLIMRQILRAGHAPMASHLLYTQCLPEDPEPRNLGINAGLAWANVAHAQHFYTDLGWSRGMLSAHAWGIDAGIRQHRTYLWEPLDSMAARARLASYLKEYPKGLPPWSP